MNSICYPFSKNSLHVFLWITWGGLGPPSIFFGTKKLNKHRQLSLALLNLDGLAKLCKWRTHWRMSNAAVVRKVLPRSRLTGIPPPRQVNPDRCRPHHRNTRNRDSFVSWRATGNPVKGLTGHMEMAMIDTGAPLHPGRDLKLNADGPASVLRCPPVCSDIPVFWTFPRALAGVLQ